MSLHASNARQCFKTRLHTDLHTDHWSSAMSLHASNARQCFKTRLHTDLQQITGAVRCPFMRQTLVNASKPVFTQIFNRSLEQCDVPSCFKRSSMLQNPSSHRSSHRSLEQCDVPSCFKHSSMLQNPSSHRSSTDHWSSSMSLHASNARQCFKTRLHTDLHTDHWSSAMSLHASNARQCFKTRLHTDLHTGHWSSAMSLHASNARQCFKTRLHIDLQQITGAVRCPFMLQTLVNASKPVFTQIFNRSLEQFDVPSCFKRSPMLQNPSSHRSSHRSLEQCDVPSCFKRSPMLQNPSSHRSSHRSLEQCDVPSCFKRSPMLQNPSSHRSSTGHWSSAMSLHASNARQCFKTRLHTDLHTDHWSSAMSLHASNARQCFKTRLHTDLHTDHWSSAMSLHASNARQCFKTRLHTDLHTDHWSSAMSLHASNARQCFKTRLHTDLQQITGAVRCPLMLQTLVNASKPVFTQIFTQITGAVRCPFMLQTLVNASKPVFTQIFTQITGAVRCPFMLQTLANASKPVFTQIFTQVTGAVRCPLMLQTLVNASKPVFTQITGAVRCPFMLQTLVNASKPVFTQIFNRSLEQCDVPLCFKRSSMLQNPSSHRSSHRSLEQCDVPSCFKRSPMLQNPSSHRSSHRSLEQCDVPSCFKRSPMLQNPSSHRSSTGHWSSSMSLHASNARQCFKTRLHTDLQQITGAVRCPFMLQTLANASKPVFTQIFNRSLEQCDVPSCFKRSPMLQNPSSHRSSTDHWSSAMSLHASNARQCFKTRLHTDLQQITGAVRCPFMLQTLVNASKPVFTQIFNRSLEQCDVPSCFKRSPMLQNPSSHRSSTDHWSSAMSLHASNARQCFKTRLHTDLQQITGAVRCPFMLQTLANASKPVFTQIFNRSLEQCDVPSCFKRSPMLQNPSSHRSSTDHWSSAMSLHASNARQCFKTRLHTDLQQVTGAVRCPFMLQTLVNASKPVFTQIFNRSLEQCDVPSCFKRSPMLQNPSSHRSSTDHWSSAMSLHASNARQCFKTRLHTDLQQITGAVRCPFMLQTLVNASKPVFTQIFTQVTGAVRCPFMLQTLVNASKPVFTQIFNRSLEQCDVPSCFKRSSMLQNPSSHRSLTDHWSSAMSLHASNARQCFKTRLHTDLQQITGAVRCPLMLQTLVNASKPVFTQIFTQITGAVRCPFMLQTLVNASKPVFTQIFNRSLEQCDVPSCFKRSSMLQNPSSHRSSTDHWSSAMSLHASNARQCFKTRLHTDLQQITGAVRCPFMLQTLANASKPVFTQIFNRSLEQCDVPSCFKRSSMLQNPSSHRSSTDHWSSAMSLHASNARQCFKTRLHTDLQQITGAVRCPFMLQTLANASKPVFTQIFTQITGAVRCPFMLQTLANASKPVFTQIFNRSLEQCDVPSCFKRSPMLQNPSSHRSSTDHWSSAMSLHASNARQCFKTRLHTDLQQITGAVRCPFMLQTLANASKPVFTQIFNRSLEQCDVPSCFKRSPMLQNPSSHRSSTDHWSSAMSLHASNARQCFKTRLHTDLQQITGAVRCPFMLQTLVNASKPVFT